MSTGPLVVSAHALDTGGGDGLVADAAVFAELDCRAVSVATSVVSREPLPLDVLARQLEAAELAGPLAAARIGFVKGATQVELIAGFVRRAVPATTVVASPVREGTSQLLDTETHDAIRRHLYPAARVVVVRAGDVASLADRSIDDLDALRGAALQLREEGARAVVVAGWVVRGRVIDFLDDDGRVVLLDTSRIQVPRIPGLAGAYAAALAAHLARGLVLSTAVEAAQRYVGFRLVRGR
jgi:hydroxymethylpyrimidine kinase/phosphomethylpyrimidine kinase